VRPLLWQSLWHGLGLLASGLLPRWGHSRAPQPGHGLKGVHNSTRVQPGSSGGASPLPGFNPVGDGRGSRLAGKELALVLSLSALHGAPFISALYPGYMTDKKYLLMGSRCSEITVPKK